MTALIQARALQLQRGTAGRRHTILSGIDCHVNAGEVLMLIGPNGAGKSTLLAALSGDLAASAGTLLFAGKPLREWSATTLARHRAVLTQHIELTLEFTVEEVVRLGCMARGLRPQQQAAIVDGALAALSLDDLRTRAVPSLSGGEQARTHLARVLAQLWPLQTDTQPRLLLLDEPCASLDPHYQHQICQVIRRFARDTGAAVVVTMHDMNLAAQYADRILALARGRCVADGTPRTVLTPAFVRDAFGVDATPFGNEALLLLATHALRQ